ncbi:MAG: hypothetical protein ACE5K7_01680 [Phycisphaerae bacterium]
MRQTTQLSVALLGLLLVGCLPSPDAQDQLLAAAGLGPGLAGGPEAGNLVINYVNQTKRPVQWYTWWEGSGSLEADTFAARLEAGSSQSLTLTGPVFRVSLGRPDTSAVAVVIDPAGTAPVSLRYSAPPLELGVDYRQGDIITFRVTPAERGRYHIGVEVTGGI